MKTVLVLTFEYPPAIIGGIGKVAEEKVKQFISNDFRVILIAPSSKAQIIHEACKIYPIPKKGNITKILKTFIYAFKICLKENIDFIYCLSGTYVGLVAYVLNKLFLTSFFTLAHGNEFIRFKNKKILSFLLKNIYNKSKAVFSVSSFTTEKLVELGVKRKKIFNIYNGVNLKTFNPVAKNKIESKKSELGIKDKSFIITTISRLDPRKSHINVIKAINKLCQEYDDFKKNCLYLIGGTGKEKEKIQSAIKELALEKTVKYIGFVADKELTTFYSMSDVFIMPSVFLEKEGSFEGFGIVFLEAAACKTMSIGGVAGGSKDAIINEKTGLLVDGNNVEKIANAILSVYKNPKLKESYSEAAYNRVLNDFNISVIFNQELSLIKKYIQ